MRFPVLLALFFTLLQSAHALPEAELQSYIEEAIKAGGGEVVIPPGVHLIEHGLKVKDAKKLRIIGLDAEAAVLKAASDKVALISLMGSCENVHIEKLTFEGGALGIWKRVPEDAKKSGNPKLISFTLARCFFQHQHSSAVVLGAAELATVEDCSFSDIKSVALMFSEGSSGGTVRHNHFIRCDTAVSLLGTTKISVVANEISDCTTGVSIGCSSGGAPSLQNVVLSNAMDHCKEAAVVIHGKTRQNSVLQNDITASGKSGIILSGESQIVKANKITGSTLKPILVQEGKHDIAE
jgi:Right handed beta helix region